MTRRKVTMLEAFQASAREAAERAAAERRRALAERDRAVRAGAPVGDAHRSPDLDLDGVVPLERGRSVHDAPLPRDEPALAPPATETEAAPALPLDVVAPGVSESEPESSRDEQPAAETPPSGPAPELTEIGKALDPSRIEEAAAFEPDVFALPMTARTFVLMQAALLATTFFLGWSIRGGGAAAAPPQQDRADDPASAALAPGAMGARPTRSGGPVLLPTSIDAGMPEQSTSARSTSTQSTTEQTPSDPDTAADDAFLDPANRFTVLAITYSRSDTSLGLAWAAYDRLSEAGLPVVKPRERGGRIFLFVGAAEAKGQLLSLVTRLKAFEGGSGDAYPFRSSFVVNLDDYRR